MKNNVNSRNRSKRSRARRRRTAAFALAFVALVIVLALVFARREPPVAQSARAANTVTPARRVHPPVWSAAQRNAARDVLARALQPGLAGASDWSIAVFAPDGTLLYGDRARRAVAPASTQKLIVAAAALHDLGDAYRFHTLLASERTTPSGNALQTLWLVGSGDPTLESTDLRGGVKQVRAGGVASVGRVVVDATAIAGEEINPRWNPDDANEDFQAATSGISLDDDTVEFRVRANAPGTSARVSIEPPSSAVGWSGQVVTSTASDSVVVDATQTPNHFVTSGAVPANADEHFYVPVHGMPGYAGAVLDRMLRDRGIAVSFAPSTGTVPLDTRILWDHRSPPLRTIVGRMLYHSDNHFAEQLMRTLGGIEGTAPTDAGGISAELAYLRTAGVPVPGIQLFDGSGLAHADRVAAVTLASILSDADRAPEGNALYPLLPRAGTDGTMRRYGVTTALGRVRAKSGHLFGVDGLAGYVTTGHGRLVFAFLVNGAPNDPDTAFVHALDALATL